MNTLVFHLVGIDCGTDRYTALSEWKPHHLASTNLSPSHPRLKTSVNARIGTHLSNMNKENTLPTTVLSGKVLSTSNSSSESINSCFRPSTCSGKKMRRLPPKRAVAAKLIRPTGADTIAAGPSRGFQKPPIASLTKAAPTAAVGRSRRPAWDVKGKVTDMEGKISTTRAKSKRWPRRTRV
ncbi:hypothetical protein J4Q44_G00386060 [Coregonus suidteri]|uniref:Uncharacterized protein n=1 Tax=Coregonus suidteri TaxID=861788 RepID=A0AAN8KQX4_9TELE